MTRGEVWRFLKERGVTQMIAQLSGSGDEGWMTSLTLARASGDNLVEIGESEDVPKEYADLHSYAEEIVYDNCSGDGDGMEATITWDVATKKITMLPSYMVLQEGETKEL